MAARRAALTAVSGGDYDRVVAALISESGSPP